MLLLRGLTSLLIGWRSFCDQIGFDRIVFLKEGVEVHDQVLDHLKYRKRLDQNLLFIVPGQLLTGKAANPVDPHSVRSADAMAARPPVREGGVLFPPDSIEAIQKPVHWIGLDLIGPVVRLLVLLRIEAEYFQFDEHVSLSSPQPIPLPPGRGVSCGDCRFRYPSIRNLDLTAAFLNRLSPRAGIA